MYYVPQHTAQAAQFAPQGWVGDMVARQAPLIGGALGGLTTELTGHPSIGGLVGGATSMIARDYGSMIPFAAGPQMAQPAAYAPQGIFGKIGGGLLGGAIGGAFGNRQLGSAIGGAVGNFLPFEAGPQMAQPVAYAPQGFWGDMIHNVGSAVGNVVGGNTGNIIRDASALGQYLPFNAGPVMGQPAAYAPQGILGGIGGGLLGGAIGKALGNKGLGSAIGGAIGTFLPFQAGPGQPIQYIPVADLQAAASQQVPAANSQIVYH